MTIEEAEEKKAYCGTCKHWRKLEEQDCEDYEYQYLMDNITRDDCAKNDFPPCVLGVCTLSNVHNFADEMYAGDYDDWSGCDWEPYFQDEMED